uniref:Uncharacterized protein n=1 Tax=Acrobeloides nanus TaxID=290746 RepID=A0A914CDI7_9BILA
MTTSNNARNILKRNHTTSSPTVEPKIKSSVAQAKVGVNSKMPEKRKTTGNTKAIKESRTTMQPATTTLDLIMNEMKSLEKDTKKKKKVQQPDSPATDENAPSTSKQFPSSHLMSGYAPLTRIELMRHENDNTLVHNFMKKETGIMETILGFKMLKGRVEPYTLEQYAHLWNSSSQPSDSHMNKMGSDAAPSPGLDNTIRRGPKTPPGPGPRTPPGPGPQTPADSESVNTVRSSSPKSDFQQPTCSPLPPPPAFPTWNNEQDGRTELLKEMSQLTKTPLNQLEANLGSELQEAIDRVDRSTLFNTLKDALRNMGHKSEEPKAESNFGESQRTKGTNEACEAMSISSGHLSPPPPPPQLASPPPPPPSPPPSSPPPRDFLTPKDENVHQPQESIAAPRFDFFHPTFVTSIAPNNMPTAIIFADPSSLPHLIGASAIPVSTTTLLPPPTFMSSYQPTNTNTPFIPQAVSVSGMPFVSQPVAPNLQQTILPEGQLTLPIQSPNLPNRDDVEQKPRNNKAKPRAKPEATVNMDFIRSRPPPIIPEILKKNMPPTSTSSQVQDAAAPRPTFNEPLNSSNSAGTQPPMPPTSMPLQLPPDFSMPPPPLIQKSAIPVNGPPHMAPPVPCPNLNVPPPVMPTSNAPPSNEPQNKIKFQLGAHCAALDSPEKAPLPHHLPAPVSRFQGAQASYVPSNSTVQPMDISPLKSTLTITQPLDQSTNEHNHPNVSTNLAEPPPALSGTNVFKTLMSALSKTAPVAPNPNNSSFLAATSSNPMQNSSNSNFSAESGSFVGSSEQTNHSNPSPWVTPPVSLTSNSGNPPGHNNFLYDPVQVPRFATPPPRNRMPQPLFPPGMPPALFPPRNPIRPNISHSISPWQYPPQ